jgi:uncharacterized protein
MTKHGQLRLIHWEQSSMQREDILEKVRLYRRGKGSHYPIKRLGIFGSVARNAMTTVSDVDVVVELDKPDMLSLIGIKQDLEEVLDCPVDIVRYRAKMSPDLKQRIDAEAVYV